MRLLAQYLSAVLVFSLVGVASAANTPPRGGQRRAATTGRTPNKPAKPKATPKNPKATSKKPAKPKARTPGASPILVVGGGLRGASSDGLTAILQGTKARFFFEKQDREMVSIVADSPADEAKIRSALEGTPGVEIDNPGKYLPGGGVKTYNLKLTDAQGPRTVNVSVQQHGRLFIGR